MTADPQPGPHGVASHRWTALSLVAGVSFVAWFAQIGADCLWLVALGDHIREHGVPEGVPFATADADGWHNVVVLAELVLSFVHGAADWALVALQVVAVVVTLVVLALDARRRGASDTEVAAALAVLVLGALPALVIVRLQLFSLPAFALLVLLLRAEHRHPSRRVWLLPLLVAVWTNLHGAVLLGVAVAGAYLLFGRLRQRPSETVAVGLSTLLALLATPQGLHTASYYWHAMQNRAAARGTGLWARIDLGSVLDVLLVGAAVVLLVLVLRRRDRVPLWEWVALAGLLLATASAARHGVWLLVFLVGMATAGRAATAPSVRSTVVTLGFPSLVAGLVLTLVTCAPQSVAEEDAVDAIRDTVGDRVVLAPGPMAELLVERGERIWVANPLDAFDSADQDAYLDFLDGGHVDTVLTRAPELGAIVVQSETEQAKAVAGTPGFRLAHTVDDWQVWIRDTPS